MNKIIRVSGFPGFLSVPRAHLSDEANTERNEFVDEVSQTGDRKPGKSRNPDDLQTEETR
ncbi:hypothetical protein [Micromonospora sp. WMMD1274]|uniref:hypothetical protein n=1 Tax=Micromonospora sp. WMMD1274 TaxID=3404116 RepID=UPI003B92C92C